MAYLSGELRGAEKREVARHLRHCQACQQLQREMDAFGGRAVAVLAPLPFLFGAKVLAKKSSVKGAALGSGAGTGVAYAARRCEGRRRGGQSAVGRRRNVGGTRATRPAPPSRGGPTTRFDVRGCRDAAAARRDASPHHAVELRAVVVVPNRFRRVVPEDEEEAQGQEPIPLIIEREHEAAGNDGAADDRPDEDTYHAAADEQQPAQVHRRDER